MLAKRIVCRVKTDSKPEFMRAQQGWGELALVPGCIAQFGGFQEDEAHIVGLWKDAASYRSFMSVQHDAMVAAQHQERAYESIDVTLFILQLDMPGRFPEFPGGVREARYLRLADCTVLPARRSHFIETQESVWHPGMLAAEGMLAGAFWQCQDEPNRFLVSSLWESEKSHADYVRYRLPELLELANPSDDLAAINGVHLKLVPAWSVLGET